MERRLATDFLSALPTMTTRNDDDGPNGENLGGEGHPLIVAQLESRQAKNESRDENDAGRPRGEQQDGSQHGNGRQGAEHDILWQHELINELPPERD
jgi:hypothetical protein